MLPDVGITEYLVIAAVALIVVGPKDLPVLMRKLGQWIGKMRNMASEFRASFDEMARQSELDDLRKEVEAMRNGQLLSPANIAADHAGSAEIQQTFADIEAGLRGGEVSMHPPMGANALQADLTGAHLPMDAAVKAKAPRKRAPKAPVITGPAEGAAPAAKPRRTTRTKA
ncbi:MAG: tatB [Caulobacter sp.]|jgi:sec-independent protein translocase protein TatB|nr:tatB [Caulobacter sp.]